MNASKVALVASTILGKICSVVGYGWVILLGLPLLAGAYGSEFFTYVMLAVMMGAGVFLIIIGRKIKRRIVRFKQYVGLLSSGNATSVQALANATAQTPEFVQNDVQNMIRKMFFTNAFIELGTGEIIIGHRQQAATNTVQSTSNEVITVKCAGCGAVNSKQKGINATCDYCGSPLA